MSKRNEHLFQFTANEIATAAGAECAYHEDRRLHWEKRSQKAIVHVKETIGAKVVERHVTNGVEMEVVVDYGDPESWREYQTACRKINTHQEAAERFASDQELYGTQGERVYELDGDDVHHFRLNGRERED